VHGDHDSVEGIGEHGEHVSGPPWILGHRGSPIEAPENTLVSLRRAIDLGLDGVEYDLHACASGEPVLIHDETLDRTTDASGRVADLTLPELAGIDAGGWFQKRFAGEPLPLLEEALELPGNQAGRFPQHMIELKDPSLVGEVARQLSEVARPLSVRLASFHRRVCLEARDLGLPAMLLAYDATEDDRRFVRDERLAAYGTAPGGWRGPAGRAEWDAERWSWSVDEPEDLLDACRAPLFGFNTNQPLRALATRALVHLTPHDDGPYPLQAPALEVAETMDATRGDAGSEHGEWSGRWTIDARVRNPFGYPVVVLVAVAVRGGAFELDGSPVVLKLEPRLEASVPITLSGGSWSPGEDPTLHARYAWRSGPGRPEESLALDHPIRRVRTVRIGERAQRLTMLRERPGEPFASMTVRRQRGELLAWVEDPGGLEDLRAVVRLGDRVRFGGRGVRLALPERAPEDGERALPFAIGFEGRDPGQPAGVRSRRLRRWCGGLPYGLRAGAPGALLFDADA